MPTYRYTVLMRTSKSPRWSPVGERETLEEAVVAAKAHWELTIDHERYVDIRIEKRK
jgi:hypothetical protein